jgi:uncharacterized membrane protein
MSATMLEWLNLLVRWVHVVAAIMWVGDSFLFMWMDSHLTPPAKPREGAVVGELYMVHSGGFYEVVKRKALAKGEVPDKLHWFKWESYTTWISGFLLLVVVYYLGGGVFLSEPGGLSQVAAVHTSLGILVASVLVYDTLWRTLGQKNATAAKYVSWALLVGLVFLSVRLFPGRAAFLQVGATLGTIMASNVFLRIIPAQKYMLAQTYAGEPVDTTLGLRAKQRSTHNHYLSLPVLFTMLSNHFPSTYGGPRRAWVLLALVVFGAALKYVMNFRLAGNKLVPAAGAVALAAAVVLASSQPVSAGVDYASLPAPSFDEVHAIVQTRCVLCHAERPSHPDYAGGPPKGLMLDTPARLQRAAGLVMTWAVRSHAMPLANATAMRDDERAKLGAWIAQGAKVPEGWKVSETAAPAPAPAATAGEDPAISPEVRSFFLARCATCHGATGKGDGVALVPKPRDYTDHAWQAAITDEQLRKVILEGGAAVGKSPLMPANPDLADKRELLDGLVRLVRSFDGR